MILKYKCFFCKINICVYLLQWSAQAKMSLCKPINAKIIPTFAVSMISFSDALIRSIIDPNETFQEIKMLYLMLLGISRFNLYKLYGLTMIQIKKLFPIYFKFQQFIHLSICNMIEFSTKGSTYFQISTLIICHNFPHTSPTFSHIILQIHHDLSLLTYHFVY